MEKGEGKGSGARAAWQRKGRAVREQPGRAQGEGGKGAEGEGKLGGPGPPGGWGAAGGQEHRSRPGTAGSNTST